jgi:nitrous oxide reductase accessory protein NosL
MPVAYTSEMDLERVSGPMRIAYLPGEANPVYFSVHGAVASHYGMQPEQIKESHASTLDYVVAAAGGLTARHIRRRAGSAQD